MSSASVVIGALRVNSISVHFDFPSDKILTYRALIKKYFDTYFVVWLLPAGRPGGAYYGAILTEQK